MFRHDGTCRWLSGIFQRGSAEKPDLVPLSLVETWLKRAVADPFFAGIVW